MIRQKKPKTKMVVNFRTARKLVSVFFFFTHLCQRAGETLYSFEKGFCGKERERERETNTYCPFRHGR